MRNLFDAYASAVQAWTASVATAAITRSANALKLMQEGGYTTQLMMKDVFEYWEDLWDFRAPAAVGVFPSASLTITSWSMGASSSSNFVQAPTGSLTTFALTPVVNPATGTVLEGLSLERAGGTNSLRVLWAVANGNPPEPTNPADRNGGLFQGAIYWRTPEEVVPDELIAPVYVQVVLPGGP